MVGVSDSESRKHTVISRGLDVEVSSDEEGFKGAWFRAIIVESPSKSASKKRKRALVEYKSLVTEDRSRPLTEYVDPAYIRPLPPQVMDRGFVEGEVVDAYYLDGWWTGVVKRVLPDLKYIVYFDNPPDVIEFEQKNLRLHLEWVDGKWVEPEKQRNSKMAGSIYSPGTKIEVSIDEDDNWYPAIVIKEDKDNSYLVKYRSSTKGNEARILKVAVNLSHIRPIPPRCADRSYALFEKVDAYYDFCWCSGLITKVLTGGRYIVFFKHARKAKELGQSEIRRHCNWIDGKWVFDCEEVLVGSDNHKTSGHVCITKDNLEVPTNLASSGAAKDCTGETIPYLTNSIHVEKSTPCESSLISMKLKQAANNTRATAVCLRPPKNLKEANAADPPPSVRACKLRQTQIKSSSTKAGRGLATPTTGGNGTKYSTQPMVVTHFYATRAWRTFEGKKAKTKERKVSELNDETRSIVKSNGRGKGVIAEGASAEKVYEGLTKEVKMSKGMAGLQVGNSTELPREEVLNMKNDQKKHLNELARDKGTEMKQHYSGSTSRRKRGRPNKIVIASSKASVEGSENHEAGDAADEVIENDSSATDVQVPTQTVVESTDDEATLKKNSSVVAGTDCAGQEIEMTESALSNNEVDEDQSLSDPPACVEDSRLSPSGPVDQSNKVIERQADLAKESPAVDVTNDISEDSQRLPFVKSSPLWETIESMEIFQKMPQKPHFHPLIECKEECREGSAIGTMITFANLVEKIRKLQFDFPRSIFDSTSETLLLLEKQGFNVKALQDSVNKLVSIKVKQVHLEDESKEAERLIMEHSTEIAKFDREMEEVMKKKIELEEQYALIQSKKELVEVDIIRLRSHANDISQSMNTYRLEFENLAATPW